MNDAGGLQINVKIDSTTLIRRLHNGEKRLAYAAVNAINQTAKRIQSRQRERVEDEFTVRRPEFIRRIIAKIKPFASVKQGRAYAEVFVDEKPRLLMSLFERGAERKPATPGARFVAEPVVGGPARPTFKDPVPTEFRMKRLNFDPMKSGKPRAAVASTHTFLIPEVGIFQRVPGSEPSAVYFFTRGRRLAARLDWLKTAEAIAEKWFPEYFEREVVKAIQYDKGRSI